MMNHFQSDRLASQYRQQLELEAARARLAHEAVAGAPDAARELPGSLGSRALALGLLVAALVVHRRARSSNASVAS